ncbi:MAG: 30S ribosome-binding factor RbfA [Chlamydiia bacterium]|nr:30S ribosome-binding factor RbfA [Chlamydiia bacterium]
MTRRTERLNSLLKEVISDVIQKEVKNPHLPELVTVTSVEISRDMQHAKVYVSVIGDKKAKEEAKKVLESAAGFISIQAAKQVVMRYFPRLRFILDESIEGQIRIETLLMELKTKRGEVDG